MNNKKIIIGLAALVIAVLAVAVGVIYYKYPDRFAFLRIGSNGNEQTMTEFNPSEITPLIKDKKYTEAKKILENYKKREVDSPELYRLLFVVNSYLGDKDAALDAVKTYVEMNPILSKYWVEYITLEINKGTEKSVIDEIYKRAFENVGLNKSKLELVNMYTSYSSFLRGYEDFDNAIKYLEMSKKLDPERTSFYDEEIKFIEEERQKAQNQY